MIKQNPQSGSAIIWILIAVTLFAALNYAFNSSSRTSTSILDDAEATAFANQIIQYGNEVKAAVKRLQLRGCSDTEISFENDIVSGYENAISPTNKSCHVFNIDGGGLSWKEAPLNALEEDFSSYASNGKYYFSNIVQSNGVGTTCDDESCTDLTMHLSKLNINVCQKINNVLNHNINLDNFDNVYNHGYDDTYKFRGIYQFISYGSKSIIGDGAGFSDYKSGCYSRTNWIAGGRPYDFFIVLIER